MCGLLKRLLRSHCHCFALWPVVSFIVIVLYGILCTPPSGPRKSESVPGLALLATLLVVGGRSNRRWQPLVLLGRTWTLDGTL